MRIIRSHQLYVPWTLRYPQVGNVQLLIILCLILSIMVYATLFLINLYTENELYLTITLCIFLTILILVSIYPIVKILKLVHDFYQIHKELRYIFSLAILILILFVIDILPYKPHQLDSIIMYALITITFVTLSLIQTKWVFYKK